MSGSDMGKKGHGDEHNDADRAGPLGSERRGRRWATLVGGKKEWTGSAERKWAGEKRERPMKEKGIPPKRKIRKKKDF